jgi:4,5-dihydroxyphthalate decarboxylase
MSRPRLRFACGLYDRVIPLYSGEVKPEGIDFEFIGNDNPRDIFDKMGAREEYDAAEMSSSEFVAGTAAGTSPFVAIPAFMSRVFRHSFITVNRHAGIGSPKDLEGKRVGVALYTMTAAVFIRGLLENDYGVNLSRIRWVQGAIEKAGAHGSPTVPPLHKKVDIEINASGRSLSELLSAGEIDAIAGATMPEGFGTDPNIVRLFPDFVAIEKDYYRRTRIFPIMHLVAIRRTVYEKHPEVAASLYRALCESKRLALQKMAFTGALRSMLPWLPAHLEERDAVMGPDPWPFGIEPNRPTLEALVNYLHQQGITHRRMPVDSLFVPVPELS